MMINLNICIDIYAQMSNLHSCLRAIDVIVPYGL